MTDWEKQLENVDPKDISVILVSPKTFEILQKAADSRKPIVHKTGFNAISYKGIPIGPSEMPRDDEFIILGKQVQWLVDLMNASPLAVPKGIESDYSQRGFEG